MAKNKIYYLLLGMGLGVVFTSSLNIAFDKPKKVQYSEQEIIQKARELGMVTIKESIESNSKKNNDKDSQESKENIESKDSKPDDKNLDDEDDEDNCQVQGNDLNAYNETTNINYENNIKNTKVKIDTQAQNEDLLKKEETFQTKEGYQIVKIIHGDTAITIANKLKTAGIINDAEEFLKMVIEKNLQRNFIRGDYQIKLNEDYEELLRILTKSQV